MNIKIFNFCISTYPSTVHEIKYTVDNGFYIFENTKNLSISKLKTSETFYLDFRNKKLQYIYAAIDMDNPKNYVNIIDVENDIVLDKYLILYDRKLSTKENRLYLLQKTPDKWYDGRTVCVDLSNNMIPHRNRLIGDKPIYFKIESVGISQHNLKYFKSSFLEENNKLQDRIDLNHKSINIIDSLSTDTNKELMYVGNFEYREEFKHFTYDYSTFYFENGEIVPTDDLDFWFFCLDNPWSQAHESWEIKCNCQDAYTEINPNKPKMYCEYKNTGMEGIIVSFRAYGDTTVEAVTKCEELLKILKKKYIKED